MHPQPERRTAAAPAEAACRTRLPLFSEALRDDLGEVSVAGASSTVDYVEAGGLVCDSIVCPLLGEREVMVLQICEL